MKKYALKRLVLSTRKKIPFEGRHIQSPETGMGTNLGSTWYLGIQENPLKNLHQFFMGRAQDLGDSEMAETIDKAFSEFNSTMIRAYRGLVHSFYLLFKPWRDDILGWNKEGGPALVRSNLIEKIKEWEQVFSNVMERKIKESGLEDKWSTASTRLESLLTKATTPHPELLEEMDDAFDVNIDDLYYSFINRYCSLNAMLSNLDIPTLVKSLSSTPEP